MLGAAEREERLESGKDDDALPLPFGMSALALLILQWMGEGAIEAELMIASNHDLMLVRQCTNPIVELHHLLQLTALGKVAGMNENIAIGYIELDVWRQGMRIGHADHTSLIGSHCGRRGLHYHLDDALCFADLIPCRCWIACQRMYGYAGGIHCTQQ